MAHKPAKKKSLTDILGVGASPRSSAAMVTPAPNHVPDTSDHEPLVAWKTSSTKRSSGAQRKRIYKPVLVKIAFVFFMMGAVYFIISAVLSFLSSSFIGKAQQQVESSQIRQEINAIPGVVTLSAQPTDSYDQQVALMEKEAILVSEYEKQLEIKASHEQEQAREAAWKAWYKIPRGCDDWRSDDQMVECINHRMSARRAFEQRWVKGKI